MHAVVVSVSIEAGAGEGATTHLRENIVPTIKQIPGFVAGYWVRLEEGNQGRAVIVFENENVARGAKEQIQPAPGVTLDTVDVGEVVASACPTAGRGRMPERLRSAVAGAAVDAYDRHVGRYAPELGRRMIEVSGVAPGQRALDVGCGTGALTVELAKVLGEGNVAAIDPSERFVAACKERAPGADVRLGIAEELPWADEEFDAVLAQLVVDGMNDARRGVGEMRRVTRPGGDPSRLAAPRL